MKNRALPFTGIVIVTILVGTSYCRATRTEITVSRPVQLLANTPPVALRFNSRDGAIYFDTTTAFSYFRQQVRDSLRSGGARQRYVGLEDSLRQVFKSGATIAALTDEYVALALIELGSVAVYDSTLDAWATSATYEEYVTPCGHDCWESHARLTAGGHIILDVRTGIT
jgi:hypothetical protein